MKKFLITLIFSISILQNSFSQWIRQTVPSGVGELWSVDFINYNTGISGGRGFNNSAVYTTNGGLNWNQANVPGFTNHLLLVQLIDESTGYAAGYDTLRKPLFLKTTDGGRNWFSYGVIPPQSAYTFLSGMDFVNENTGYVIASASPVHRSNILKTTNGGLSWVEQLPSEVVGLLTSIQCLDTSNAITVGYTTPEDGIIMKSVNGGVNWTSQIIDEVRDLQDVFFTNSLTGFVTGYSENPVQSFVYKTTNQGLNWNIVWNMESTNIAGIQFYPGSGTGIISGQQFILPHTFTAAFTSRTTDFGNNWGAIQHIDSNNSAFGGVMLISPVIVYIAGGVSMSQGSIYHTTNGGGVFVNQIGNSIPEKFSLSQNHPNPFNPVTEIEFSIPTPGYTDLIIFDVLGKVVAVLVNEHLSVGTYSVNFKAVELASGIYFYKIVSGNFTDVKKMTMIK